MMAKSGKVYLHLLNRYIDIRLNSGRLFSFVWRVISFPLTMRSLKKAFGPQAMKKYRRLLSDMRSKDSVDRSVFESLVIKGDYFNE